MKRKIFSPSILKNYHNQFVNHHSKAFQTSPIKLEELGKDFNVEGKTLTLVGYNDDGYDKHVIFHEKATGHHYQITGLEKARKAMKPIENTELVTA